jgi:uncharacterized protein
MECFGRATEAADLWHRFNRGDNVLMLAPRRIGKTVLMNHLLETAGEHGYRALLLNVEGLQEEKEVFRECCAAIQEELSTGKRVMAALSQRLNQVMAGGSKDADWRATLLQSDWQDFASNLFAHLDEPGDDNKPWLLLVDELPVFVQALHARRGAEAVSSFLYWLRKMRQKHKNVRWLYAGSIGLDTIARRTNVEGALNDLHPYTLSPFSPDTATAFLQHVGQRCQTTFEPDAITTILTRLGWLSPRYLAVIADDAIALSQNQAVTPSAANAAMDKLLELDKRLYWSNWREHIDRNFAEPDRSHLHSVLQAIAKDSTGVTEDTLRATQPLNDKELRILLDVLVNDGYLDLYTGGRFKFRMNLLREWWLRYVVL